SWSLGDDFDVTALDLSLSSTISDWAELPTHLSTFPDEQGDRQFVPVEQNITVPQTRNTETPVQQNWFSHRGSIDSKSTPLMQGNQVHADESYRAGLSRRLQPRVHDEALPPFDTLNLFAKLYFTRFHPLFPVIHAASFRPTTENALLFLSICSVGSLFAGSQRAVAQGTRIFERLNKAILASWESILSGSKCDAVLMVQAGVIGQTFAILSGRPRDLLLADVLHGTVNAWMREATKGSPIPPDRALDTALSIEENWHRWVDAEQQARIYHALRIHDAELASLLHHEPVLRHRGGQKPDLAPDVLFTAPTAAKWAALYHRLEDPTDIIPHINLNSSFSAYSQLESINARLIDARRSHSFDTDTANEISHHLIEWRTQYNQTSLSTDTDPLSLPILWHAIYLSLYADINLLEQAIGRDGHDQSTNSAHAACTWASSPTAKNSLIHALLIQRHIETMRVSTEPAIHVPRALFHAGLVWLSFWRFTTDRQMRIAGYDSIPEIRMLGAETVNMVEEGMCEDGGHVVYRVMDLLRRVGRWGIAETFARVLGTAVEGV
ncbi:hypothetical protein ASPWEDRAFT_95508, partial [Aspergillus wentii DTO 134E9]